MNSEPRKRKAKNAPKMKNAERVAATSVRLRTAEPGTSGDRDRASIRTKADSITTDAANRPSVAAAPQPQAPPPLSASTTRSSPPPTPPPPPPPHPPPPPPPPPPAAP